jgi:hypothetical protein
MKFCDDLTEIKKLNNLRNLREEARDIYSKTSEIIKKKIYI